MTDFIACLRAISGGAHVLTPDDDIAPYLREQRGLFNGRALAVVRPSCTREVAHIVRLARQHRVLLSHKAATPVSSAGAFLTVRAQRLSSRSAV